MSIATDASLGAESLAQRITKHNRRIFDRVMRINVQITHRLDLEVNQAVTRKKREHVIEETVSGIDGGNARAIEIEAELNVSFGGFARLCRAA